MLWKILLGMGCFVGAVAVLVTTIALISEGLIGKWVSIPAGVIVAGAAVALTYLTCPPAGEVFKG